VTESIDPAAEPVAAEPVDVAAEPVAIEPVAIDAALKELWQLSDATDWDALERTGSQLLADHPQHEEIMSLVAYALWHQGSLVDAAALAAEAVAISPSRYLSLFTAGAAHSSLGNVSTAHDYFQLLHRAAPTDAEAIRRLVRSTAAVEGIHAADRVSRAISTANGVTVETTVATVRSVTEWAGSHGIRLMVAGEVESIPFTPPRLVGEKTHESTFALSNQPYVAELPDVRIFGNSSLILTADGFALNDDRRDPRFGSAVSFEYEPIVLAQDGDDLLLAVHGMPTRQIDRGVFLSGLASSYYGHWLPQFLPKLQFLEQHPDFASAPIIVDDGMPQSHFDHLERLTDNPLIRLLPGESFACERLLVAPSPTFFPVEYLPNTIPVETIPGLSMRAMAFLRRGTEFPPTAERTRRIFLARKNMRWRRLINEPEITAQLLSLGFEVVYLEDRGLEEQIRLFQEAEWIVAPNGSALLNLVFADTAVRLVILTQPSLFNWGTFQGPMDALGYESVCVRGEYADSEARKHSDYRVSVAAVLEALAGLGMAEATRSSVGH
jgi:tetratricopeptide (TPR) repeat protein